MAYSNAAAIFVMAVSAIFCSNSVTAYTSRTPYAVVQAETFNASISSGATIATGGGGTYVGPLGKGDYIGFSQLDFQDGPLGVKMHLSSLESAGNDAGIAFLKNNLESVPFHVTRAGSTHNIETWVTTTEFITWSGSPGGKFDLYLLVLDSHGETINIDWIQFFQ